MITPAHSVSEVTKTVTSHFPSRTISRRRCHGSVTAAEGSATTISARYSFRSSIFEIEPSSVRRHEWMIMTDGRG
ncbi:hypothetical protein E2C01_053322 [Portunus trituberculatus]|uniref:Uncharacterized protein n=1 Tax=Portunus trituberculatus TaxID=210409 RepID=A0A5B7GP57_PORTR|nr:hypothetical protein [Portunus trituberculatus]